MNSEQLIQKPDIKLSVNEAQANIIEHAYLGNPDNKSAGPNQKLYPHNHWEGMFIHNINAILKGINH